MTVSGVVRTADDGPRDSLLVIAATGGYADTGRVASDGRFAVTALRATADSTIIRIRGVRGSSGAYQPSWKILPPLEKDVSLRVLLIPRSWTIDAGTFAGEVVPVSLQTAFAPENAGAMGDGHLFGVGEVEYEDGLPLSPLTFGWPVDSLPLAVYFEHEGSSFYGPARKAVTPEDSVSIWAAFTDLELRLGTDLFRPAVKSELPVDSLALFPLEGTEHRFLSVGVELVPGLMAASGLGVSAATCTGPPSAPDEACDRFGPGLIVEGRLSLRPDVEADPDVWAFLVAHEMGHVLGFGHACYFPSLMIHCSGSFPLQILDEGDNSHATRYDAAYMQLYWRVHERSRAFRPHLGLAEALEGERLGTGYGRLPPGWNPAGSRAP